MAKENNKKHKHIDYFNPDVEVYNNAHQDLLSQFNAGEAFFTFNDFLSGEVPEYTNNGDGVTYLVWNILYDDEGLEEQRTLIAYYTLSATSIPYIDKIRLDEEEAKEKGRNFDIETCGIPALEIKMFAVDEQYQDLFYEYEDEDLPIAAWIMRNIVDYAHRLLNTVLGFKAIFLHSVPNAESFYLSNGFHPVEINMKPLHCIDSDLTAMYLSLKEVYMNYDD